MTDPFAERLQLHLRSWVGSWPPPGPGVTVIGDAARLEPTWDGEVRPLQGVGDGVVVGDNVDVAVGEGQGSDGSTLLRSRSST